MKKLLLIDGNSLLFRCFYATGYDISKIMRTKDGRPSNALFALSNMMMAILSRTKPDYAIIAFDTDAKTLRHKTFSEYKGLRKAAPEELIAQMKPARKLLTAFGLHVIEIDGYEADDIIGTFAKSYQDLEITIFSSDKDLLQLIGDNVQVVTPIKGVSETKIVTVASLLEEEGLTPQQIPDYKGLVGDSSDNIPGVPGIGEVTAKKLLAEYQNLETILANLEQDSDLIKGKLREKLIDGAEKGRISKELATIYLDVPVDKKIDKYAFNGVTKEELEDFFRDYEMTLLLKKLAGFSYIEEKKEIKESIVDFENVQSVDKTFLVDGAMLAVVYDQDNYHLAEILGLAILRMSDGKIVYISKETFLKDDALIAFLEDGSRKKRGYNIKAIYVLLHRLGIIIQGFDFDYYLAGYLLSLSFKDEPNDLLAHFDLAIPYKDKVFAKRNYTCDNCIVYYVSLLSACAKMDPKIFKLLVDEQLLKLLQDLELPLSIILANMEINGITIDGQILEELNAEYVSHLNKLTENIYKLAGHQFNVNSPRQVGDLLFDEIGLPANKKRSTGIDVLEALAPYHPIVPLIIEHRKYAKLISTYSEGLKSYLFPDSKLHTIFNQATTQTGRLSSSSPNLQQIAVRDEVQRLIRKAFVAPKNHYLLSIDYSQIELRILAHLSKDETMIEAFNNDLDIHTMTASKIFHLPLSNITSDLRRKAKAVNFGIIYGMSDWGLADEIAISVGEAKQFISNYFHQFSSIKSYLDQSIQFAKQNGYSLTILGRKRKINELSNSAHMIREFGKRIAMNSPIQGSAADIIKKAMIDIDKYLKQNNLETKMILQIHDELIFEVPLKELDKILEDIEQIMENTLKLEVKLKVESGYATDWFGAK